MMMFWRALRAGEILTDPEKWKNRGDVIQALIPVIGVVLWGLCKFGLDLDMTEEEIVAFATGIAAFMGAIGRYFTVATTRKLGVASLKGKPESTNAIGKKPQGIGD